MIYIAHRGNITGKNANAENNPDYIDLALSKHYDAEIDLQVVNNSLWLGHDVIEYKISLDWLLQRKNALWIHCKNFEALELLSTTNLNYFWHENDSYTLTSWGYGWVYPGNKVYKKSVLVMPTTKSTVDCYGICLDNFDDWKNND